MSRRSNWKDRCFRPYFQDAENRLNTRGWLPKLAASLFMYFRYWAQTLFPSRTDAPNLSKHPLNPTRQLTILIFPRKRNIPAKPFRGLEGQGFFFSGEFYLGQNEAGVAAFKDIQFNGQMAWAVQGDEIAFLVSTMPSALGSRWE